MKITKSQLKQIIKEELSKVINEEDYDRYRDRYGHRGGQAAYLRKDRIKRQQIKREKEMTALGKADAEAGKPRDESITHKAYHIAYDLETDNNKESPDDIVARFPSSRPGEPDQVIYRWQQEEFDERERALKAFNKRKKK